MAIGVVIIGRNEGERLRAGLASVVGVDRRIVYVDSGSQDGSPELAKSMGAITISLDPSQPFTAARGRNAGWRWLVANYPDLRLIQFVDGDCEVAEGWLEIAQRFAAEHDDVAVIFGRRREVRADRNMYHRLTDMEWNIPVGETKYCGGDALIRVDALEKVDGYRDDLIAGEEPELCVRLRQAGWRIWRINAEMTRHDINMSTFKQWWLRALRSGHAYAEGASLHGAPPVLHWRRESRSIWLWGGVLPLAGVVFAWPTQGISLVVSVALYGLLLVKILVGRSHQHGESIRESAEFALMCVVGKIPQALGQCKFLWRRLGKGAPTIIEYSTKSGQ